MSRQAASRRRVRLLAARGGDARHPVQLGRRADTWEPRGAGGLGGARRAGDHAGGGGLHGAPEHALSRSRTLPATARTSRRPQASAGATTVPYPLHRPQLQRGSSSARGPAGPRGALDGAPAGARVVREREQTAAARRVEPGGVNRERTVARREVHRNDVQGALELAVFAGGRVTRHPLPAEGRVSLGRSPENDVPIDDSSVSRRHAIIHLGPPIAIEDLGSANGTRLRRERSAGPTTKLLELQPEQGKTMELAVEDAVNLGSTLIVILPREGAASAAPGQEQGQPIVLDPGHGAALRAGRARGRRARSPCSCSARRAPARRCWPSDPPALAARAGAPFVQLNCAALSESLARASCSATSGAFTGARPGEAGPPGDGRGGHGAARRGGRLPPSIQVKLPARARGTEGDARRGPEPAAHRRALPLGDEPRSGRRGEAGRFPGGSVLPAERHRADDPPLQARIAEIAPLARRSPTGPRAPSGARRRRSPRDARRAGGAPLARQHPRAAQRHRARGRALRRGHAAPEHLLLDAAAALPALEARPAAAPAGRSAAVPAETTAPRPTSRAACGNQLDAFERQRIVDALEQCAGGTDAGRGAPRHARRTFVARLSAYGIPRPRKGKATR